MIRDDDEPVPYALADEPIPFRLTALAVVVLGRRPRAPHGHVRRPFTCLGCLETIEPLRGAK